MNLQSIRDCLANKHPIILDEKTHQYYVYGERYQSVTKILENLDEPFDTKAKALQSSQNPYHEFFGKPVEWIIETWNQNNALACDRGHAIHSFVEANLLEDLIKQMHLMTNKSLNLQLVQKYMAFRKEKLEAHNFQIAEIECRIASPRFKVAGTFDSLFWFPNIKGLYIFDWKTNAKWNDYSDFCLLPPFQFLDKSKWTLYTLQLHIYRWILENEYGIQPNGSRIIWLNETEGVVSKPPKFEYKPKMIEEVIRVCSERSFAYK